MRLRRIVTGVVALTAALLVAGYAIIASLDVQQVADFARAEVKAATGRDLTIAGSVELSLLPRPAIRLEDLHLANAEWGSRPDMVSLRRLEVEVALLPLLTGDVVVRRLVMVEPDILLETDAEGRGNWELAEGAPPASAPEGQAGAVSLPDVQDFRIEGGVLRLVEVGAGERLRLEVREAVGSLPSAGGSRDLRLAVTYNGQPIEIEGRYGGLPALLSGAPAPLDVTLRAGGATLTAKGTAGDLTGAPQAELAVTAAGETLAALGPLLASELPSLGPYDLSTNLKISDKVIDLSGIALRIADSDLTGNLSFATAGARPALRGALISKLLDLDRLTAGGEEADAGATAGGDGQVFSDTPLPLEALRAVDAEVKLEAERLRAGGLDFEAVQTVVSLKAGDLVLDPFSTRLAGGPVTGRLALAASKAEPDGALRLDGKDIDFGALLRQAAVTEDIGGPLELAVDVKGRGASPRAIAASLDGRMQAVSLDGTVDNDLLRVLSVGLGDILGPLFGSGETTRLECLVARFDFAQGQGYSRALVFDTGAFAIAGQGGVDLREERVSLAFDTETSQPSLASLAVPFHVSGPLASPSVSPDPIGAAVGVVGTAGDVAQTGVNIVGGAVDAVGGLFGTGPIIGRIGSGQTLCGEALAAIGRGPAGAAQSSDSSGSSNGFVDGVGRTLKGAGENIERGLKSLFGN